MTLLLRTVSGSHLYGLNHAGSDLDYYQVVADNPTVRRSYSRQSIVDGVDTTTVALSTWLRHVEAGVPQACEAMMSQVAEVDLIKELRASYVLGSGVWSRYLQTLKSHAFEDVGTPQHILKRKRHALRYGWNLREMRETGRFNPTLTPYLANLFTNIVNHDSRSEFIYDTALKFAGFIERETWES